MFDKRKPQRFQSTSGKKKASEKLDNWNSLVARSLLYRVAPDHESPIGQSGAALCVNEKQEDGTYLPKVAGFQSFVQESGWVQNYDDEGDIFNTKLHKGRIAFYGAFSVPDKVRDNFEIC